MPDLSFFFYNVLLNSSFVSGQWHVEEVHRWWVSLDTLTRPYYSDQAGIKLSGTVYLAQLIKVWMTFFLLFVGTNSSHLRGPWLCLNGYCLLPINLLTAVTDSISCLINPAEIVWVFIRERWLMKRRVLMLMLDCCIMGHSKSELTYYPHFIYNPSFSVFWVVYLFFGRSIHVTEWSVLSSTQNIQIKPPVKLATKFTLSNKQELTWHSNYLAVNCLLDL